MWAFGAVRGSVRSLLIEVTVASLPGSEWYFHVLNSPSTSVESFQSPSPQTHSESSSCGLGVSNCRFRDLQYPARPWLPPRSSFPIWSGKTVTFLLISLPILPLVLSFQMSACSRWVFPPQVTLDIAAAHCCGLRCELPSSWFPVFNFWSINLGLGYTRVLNILVAGSREK